MRRIKGPGRPSISGDPVGFKPGAGLLAKIDAYAAAAESSRADALRDLLTKGFSVAEASTSTTPWRSYASDSDESRRAQILSMSAEGRALLAEIMQRELDAIPAKIAELEDSQRRLTLWLAEFGPRSS